MRRWRTLWLALGWAIVAAIVYGSVMHSPPSLGFEQSDKLEHIGGYGLAMFWFCQLYRAGVALGWISALVFPAARARAR